MFPPACCPNVPLLLTIPTPPAPLVFHQGRVSLNAAENKNLNPAQRIRVLTERTRHREVIVPLLQIELLQAVAFPRLPCDLGLLQDRASRAELGIEVRSTHFQISPVLLTVAGRDWLAQLQEANGVRPVPAPRVCWTHGLPIIPRSQSQAAPQTPLPHSLSILMRGLKCQLKLHRFWTR